MTDLALSEQLRSAYGSDIISGRNDATAVLILHGQSVRVPTTLEVGGGMVRLYAGRIVHAVALEDQDDLRHVVALVEAVQRGGACELYSSEGGTATFVGHTITGDGFRYETTDVDVSALTSVPL